jgi:hypothetical protein
MTPKQIDNDPDGPFEPIPAMPPAIAAAVVNVMRNVKRLTRTDENKFQKYMYTSIDNFLESTGPLCAAAGLMILAEEEDVEITQAPKADREGTSNFLRVRWGFTLAHASGVTYGPLHRTVIVPAAGAQAFGSSQSYALKQFMRGLFQIPTGDNDDPDSGDKPTLPANETQKPPARKPPAKTNGQKPDAEATKKAAAERDIAAADKWPALCELADRLKASSFSEPVLTELTGQLVQKMFDKLTVQLETATSAETLDKMEKLAGAYFDATRQKVATGLIAARRAELDKFEETAAPA